MTFLDDLKAKKAKSEARKQKRALNAEFQNSVMVAQDPLNRSKLTKAGRKGRKRPMPRRGPLKAKIVRLLGLLDRKLNGGACRIHGAPCFGTLSYHIVPASRGDSTRFLPENVVWACRSANYGEFRHRSLYRQKHIDIFGKERIEALEAKARETVHLKMFELRELYDALKKKVESGIL